MGNGCMELDKTTKRLLYKLIEKSVADLTPDIESR